jgi:hypothetical protein
MRLLVTSDVHYDPRGRLTDEQTIAAMIARMQEEHADCAVLAGDVAHGLDAFAACVEMFATALACPVYVLAGNHDLWRDKARGISSEALWTCELRAATEKAGAIWLEGTRAIIAGVGLCGSLAWYDYSGLDVDAEVSREEAGRLKQHLNNDAHRIDWQRDDPQFAGELADALVHQLGALAREVEAIALVTHVPIFEEQMHRKPGNRDWGVGNAFFGHLTLGARVRDVPQLRAVVSGHTHWGTRATLAREGLSPLDVRVVGSDYKIPNYLCLDL